MDEDNLNIQIDCWVCVCVFMFKLLHRLLWPRGLQHARLSCPSLSPGVCSNWCPTSFDVLNHLIFCLPLLPSVFPSIKVFSSDSALCIRWPKYWNFSIRPSIEYSGLISFRIDWFDLLAVQGTLKSFFQHHNLKASILWCSAFFIVQFSHPYMTTGKAIAFTIWTFVGKVMSLLFNMLSRFVTVFLPRSKCLSISWLQSLSTVILEPRNVKSVTASTFFPSVYHEVMGPDVMILIFSFLSFHLNWSVFWNSLLWI